MKPNSNGIIFALAVLPNGDLVSGSSDKTIKIWNTQDGTLKKTLTGHTNWINDLIAVDQNRLISASDDRTIKIWNSHQKSVIRTLTDNTIKIWNIEDGTLKRTVTGHITSVRA